MPPNWNGTLGGVCAHSYRGTGNEVSIGGLPVAPVLRGQRIRLGRVELRDEQLRSPGDGVVGTHDLLEAFPKITGLRSRQVIMSGLSMGGEVAAAEIEAYKGDFAGAMPYCGVLAFNNLFNYYLGDNVAAAGLTGTTISYPTTLAAGEAYSSAYQSAGGVRAARPRDHPRRGDRRADVHDRPHQDRDAVGRHRRAVVRRYPCR